MVRLRRIVVAAIGCAALAGVAVAVARPAAGAPEALRPVAGAGELRFTGTDAFGVVTGTATTKVVPATIKPGEPVRFTVNMTWTETDQMTPCPYGSASGSTPSQTTTYQEFAPTSIRPGHGEDLLANHGIVAPADVTSRVNGSTWACGPPNHITRTEGYEARVPGSATTHYTPGCYAAFPNAVGLISQDLTMNGTFATLSVGGVNCATGAVAAGPVFTDTFSASGQVKPHAVAVPPGRTRAEVTLRWTKPGDRFTLAGIVLAPKRQTASVGRAEKLKITFFALSPTAMRVGIRFLTLGKLTFRVVSKRVSGLTTVRTRVVLKT